MSLAEALESAASALEQDADAIRPANGDPFQLLDALDDAAAVRVLHWLLVNEPKAGEELAISWSEEDDGLPPLLQIDEGELPKAARKALRKIHHRLRSAGVEIERGQTDEQRVGRLNKIDDSIAGAFITPVDPRGGYLVFLIEPHPSGGGRLFQLMLDEGRGVVGFDVFSAGRSKLRSFVKKLQGAASATGPGAVDADPDAVRALVKRIAEIHPSERVLPRSFSEWRRKLVEGAAATGPGQQAREALGANAGDEALERVAARVEAQELGPWPPDPSILAKLGEQLTASLDNLSELGEDEAKSVIEGSVNAATGALFCDEHAEHTALRFEENAYVLWKSGREDEARDCLAAAAAIRQTRDATNPVALAMTRACYGPAIEQMRQGSQAAEVSDRAPDEAGT